MWFQDVFDWECRFLSALVGLIVSEIHSLLGVINASVSHSISLLGAKSRVGLLFLSIFYD